MSTTQEKTQHGAAWVDTTTPLVSPGSPPSAAAADGVVNVLAVDDRPDGLLALRAVLEAPGTNLVTVASGAEALSFLDANECAVILLDVQMPVMDGFETAKMIRRHDPAQDTPIIFVTAINKDRVHMHRGYELGAVDYVFKPFDPPVLRAKVAAFAALYRNRQLIARQAEQIAEANRLLRQEVAERREAQELLVVSRAQLKALSARLLAAQEEERRRIAQDLHDDLGQVLTCIDLDLQRALRAKADGAHEILKGTAVTLKRAMASTRELATTLRPPLIDGASLEEALRHLIETFEVRTGVRARLEGGTEETVLSDLASTNVYRIIQEALNNVQKHAQARNVIVSVSFSSHQIRISVRDDGQGCDPAAVRSSKTLGLVSMKERAELFGGEWKFTSAPGRGTEIKVVVPRARVAARPATVAASQPVPAIPDAAARPLRVVLADDHALIREGCARLLQEHDAIRVVGQAANGEEAVELAVREQPDVLVLDYSMPVMDGAAATTQVRALAPGVKILVLTMHDSSAIAARLLNLGADGYLVKSEAGTALVEAVRCVADGRPYVSSGILEKASFSRHVPAAPGSPPPSPASRGNTS